MANCRPKNGMSCRERKRSSRPLTSVLPQPGETDPKSRLQSGINVLYNPLFFRYDNGIMAIFHNN
jgi:hypothetical protein